MTQMDMAIADALHYVVLFSAYIVVWFFCLFMLLPVPFGSPRDPETGLLQQPQLAKKALWAAFAAALLWSIFYATIHAGLLDL